MKGTGKYILIGIGLAVILVILWYFKSIVAYILISAVFSLIGRPIVDLIERIRIRRFHLPKALSAAITLIILWGIFISFFTIFVPLIVNQMAELSTID
jgi:predicted PurR-regulated permease PerM